MGSGVLFSGVKAAYSLLPQKSHLKFIALVIASMATSIADLVGVALIGLVTLALVSLAGASNTVSIPILGTSSAFSNPRAILALSLLALVFLIGKSLVGGMLSRRTLLFLASRQATVTTEMMRRLVRQPLTQIEARTTQDTIYSVTTGVAAAIVGVLGSGALALSEIALLVILGVGLVIVNPFVSLVTGILFVLVALITHRVLGKWAGETGDRLAASRTELMRTVQEAIQSYRELVVTNRMDSYLEQREYLVKQDSHSTAMIVFITQIPKYVYETSLLVGVVVLAGWAFQIQSLPEAVSTVAIFMAAGSRILPSLLRLQNALISIRSSSGLATPTWNLWESFSEAPLSTLTRDASKSAGLPEVGFEVQAIDLTCGYPGSSRPAISRVSFTVPGGSTFAIVGPTGAGKSSLADAILGILPVSSGQVLINHTEPLSTIQQNPGRIGYVPQSVSLVSGTVAENIALGIPPCEIDRDRIWDLLRLVRLDELLLAERNGLDTDIGERGVRLSGGQCQRLGLARALYGEPKLLILDEATSALDAETESAISSAISSMNGESTIIVIAHRLATIRDFQQVAYIGHGGVLQGVGSFLEVRNQVQDLDDSARILGL